MEIFKGDFSHLSDLKVDTILRNLKVRFQKDIIYSRCGDILIAVNPYREIPIYTKEYHDSYHWRKGFSHQEPHIFATTGLAYKRLLETKTDQVILVSGESGAGKTETTKYVIKHVVQMCGSSHGDLHTKILNINPLMEAFGNARTSLNENSSRFAKFIQINFGSDGEVQGALVRDYLLEKSRVVLHPKGERNFHIFYAFLAGIDSRYKDTLLLDNREFRIAQHWNKNAAYYKKYYLEVLEIMKLIEMSREDIEAVHIILAAILHITEIEFETDADVMAMGVIVLNEDDMIKAANLLELDVNTFGKGLVSEKKIFSGEEITTLKNLEQAESGRDALAKALYERLFGWMIRNINSSLQARHKFGTTGSADSGSLGILDICGFEIMQSNGLEQLCINLVNEQLQGFMNHQVFKREQEIYSAEGLTLENIDYPNNAEILMIFNKKKIGIIDLIDEDTKLCQATDSSMVHKLVDRWGHNHHFICPKYDTPEFGIRHFAGNVMYDASNFLDKNGDDFSADLYKCVVASKNGLISDLFQVQKSMTGSISTKPFSLRASKYKPSSRLSTKGSAITKRTLTHLRSSMTQTGQNNRSNNKTISTNANHKTQLSFFTASIKDLLDKMNSAEPLFVRCIKPNIEQRSKLFVDGKVTEQLNYLGIKEIAKIRKLCYPVRRTFEEFHERYCTLMPNSTECIDSSKTILRRFIEKENDYCLGRTQIFMMEGVKEILEGVLRILTIRQKRIAKTFIRKWKEVIIGRKLERELKKAELERKRKENQKLRTTSVHFPQKVDMDTIIEVPTPAHTVDDPDYSGSITISQSRAGKSDDYLPDEDKNVAYDDTDAFFDMSNSESDEETEELQWWDPFEIVPREWTGSETAQKTILRVVKLLLYLFLFVCVLGCCVAQKLSLIILVTHFPTNTTQTEIIIESSHKKTALVNCVLAICIPYVLNILSSGSKILFGHFKTPSKTTFLVVIVTDLLHTFGLCLLILGVLPYHNKLLVPLLLTAVAIMPSILHLVTATHRANSNAKIAYCANSRAGQTISFMLDGLCILLQASVIPVMILWFNKPLSRQDSFEKKYYFQYFELVGGFICVSFGWWENFLDDRLLCSVSRINKIKNVFLSIRYELQEGRHCTIVVAQFMKILLTVGMTCIYYPALIEKEYLKLIIEELHTIDDNILVPIITLHLSAFVAFYLTNMACKLHMQIVAFSMPIMLVTPGVILILCVDCQVNFLNDWWGQDIICPKESLTAQSPWIAIGAAWYFSLWWITRHIWYPKQERLAKYERMFVNPLYCSMLTTESFILNRRRHMRRVQKCFVKKDKNTVYYKLAKTESKEDDELQSTSSSVDTESVYQQDRVNNVEIPVIYACATMWHETRTEMVQLLKSLHRIDADQWMRKQAQELSSEIDPEFFQYEAHIFFDDIMEPNDDDEWQVNDFVAMLVDCMEEAISSVHNMSLRPHPPIKIPTPYGGQLLYKMPGGNLLYVHLKDKNKIRHRKRWSQVMYMYYLLGYKLLKDCEELAMDAFKDENERKRKNWKSYEDFENYMSEETRVQSQNTFILALDGDTDFNPVAVRLLLDRMKKNEKAAAACGRIHPIGSGPLVWFQKFEYAVGHWLQKATEHVFGCVLCSPGCFSLFRGSALMDQNVMRKYTILPTDAGHYLQYDQGEDRWLCTLLLQQGYRVDYAAAADAVTYAPEGFNEFFNQRRRWMPSTLANIMDLLVDYKNTVSINNNISILYIIYQMALMVSTVLGPATVIMMIASALKEVFGLSIWVAYGISLGPAVVFIIICLSMKTNIQLTAAAFLSTFYAFIMMMVLAATIISVATKSLVDPSVIFITGLVSMFAMAGLIHPYEISCLPWGALYFLCIPSGYLLLVIFSMCNLDNVSWGTREIPKKKTQTELEAEQKATQEKKREGGFLTKMFFNKEILKDIIDLLSFKKTASKDTILSELKAMNQNMERLLGKDKKELCDKNEEISPIVEDTSSVVHENKEDKKSMDQHEQKETPKRDDLKDPFWIKDARLGNGSVGELDENELMFWKDFIKKYLTPLEKNVEKEKWVKASLIDLRNNVVYGMCMINLLWIGINFVFQVKPTKATSVKFEYKLNGKEEIIEVDILGLLFIFFFAVILVIQFIGMLIHRYSTFLHLMSITELREGKMNESKFEEMLECYKRMHMDTTQIGITRTKPPDMCNGVPRSVCLRTTQIAQIRKTVNPVSTVVVDNIRKTSKYLSRPLPAIVNPFTPNTFLRELSTTMNQATNMRTRGFNLRKTTKGLMKRVHQAGIEFEDGVPEPDYGDDDIDPVYDFLQQDANVMSRQFASKYLVHNQGTRRYKPKHGTSNHHYMPPQLPPTRSYNNNHNMIDTTQF